MATRKKSEDPEFPKRPPARTPEARQNEMVALAFDQAELMLREGKAPAPIVVHYLKLGTETSKLEVERLRSEISLRNKQVEQVDQADRIEELTASAIKQMTIYQGHGDAEDYEDYGR